MVDFQKMGRFFPWQCTVLLAVLLLLLWLLQVELEEDSEDEGFEDRPLKLEEISRLVPCDRLTHGIP